MIAQVVKLDRGLPLLREGERHFRAEYCAKMSKKHVAVAIGDNVEVSDCEPFIINNICARNTELVRNDPVDRNKPQVLAANFDQIVICNPINDINERMLRRELCIARNAGVPTLLLFTKCDLSRSETLKEELLEKFSNLFDGIYFSGRQTEIEAEGATIIERGVAPELSPDRERLISARVDRRPQATGPRANNNAFGELFRENSVTVLLGKSGVGKSTLINTLAGREIAQTGEVRESDSKGRHTTVAREIYDLGNFRIIDMPGVRSLGLIDCDHGIEAAFPEILTLSQNCKFRDCSHKNEPGCAVKGNVDEVILACYHELVAENTPQVY